MIMMSETAFNTLAEQGYQRIPLIQQFNSDLDTPLSLYLKMAHAQSYSFLLESIVGGEQFARYSYVGFSNGTRIQSQGYGAAADTKFIQVSQDLTAKTHTLIDQHTGNPLNVIQQLLKQHTAPQLPDLPRFSGGWVGYFGYETIHHIEPTLPLPKSTDDDIALPDIQLMLCETLLVIDNLTAKSHLIKYINPVQSTYAQGRAALDDLCKQLQQASLPNIAYAAPAPEAAHTHIHEYAFKYTFAENAYLAAVAKAKAHIEKGEAMQIVISQRMHQDFQGEAMRVYRALRALNPSPYMYFYRFDDAFIVGASPELLVKLTQNTVTLRPIAGTCPRGKNSEQDAAFAQKLLADPKECAEHTMLIDLARNDIGRIAQTGTVKVREKMKVECYSHVQHIVSSVEGCVSPTIDPIDVLRAVFPAGTLSGAPKVSAMRIIRDLEPHKRSIYGGAVGYISFNGEMDLAISIRTAVIYRQTIYVQAGAGVVYDSIPQKEWQETKHKSEAVWQAIYNTLI